MKLKMISRIFSLALLGILAGCNSNKYGSKVDAEKAVNVKKAFAEFESSGSESAVIEGSISKVCQTEGCWFNYQLDNAELLVDFDHKFEIPKNSAGKIAISQGKFSRDTTSVEQLREWAKDDGASDSAIQAINKPEVKIIFRATGVILK